jgi:hypothetical protein
MMMSMIHRLHTVERQPSAQMCAAWCGLVVSLSPTNFIGGKLGQQTSKDSRYIRH